jgi:hypothetical protein
LKAHYRAFNGKLLIEVEGSNIKELFAQIGPVAEVLDGDDCCGKCGSTHIYPRAREATKKSDGKVVNYYELVCSDCRAKLSFGQHSEGGTLWAKRADDQGNALENRGWEVYLGIAGPKGPPAEENMASAPRSAQAPRQQASPGMQAHQWKSPLAKQIFERCTDRATTNAELWDICEALVGLCSVQDMETTWKIAVTRHGDPQHKPSALAPVIEDLIAELTRLQAKRETAAK